MSETTPHPADSPANLNDQIQQRYHHLELWRQGGHDPFGRRVDNLISTAEARALYTEGIEETEDEPAIAGRLMTIRLMGKSIFADVQDSSGRLQIYAQKNVLGEGPFEELKRLDMGDIVTVTGRIFKTRLGEITMKVAHFRILSKALLPLPEKFHGLTDVETRHRQRYLDLISNPDSLGVFKQRIRIVREIRAFMEDRGFAEVETPMLQLMPGGAAARPFETHYHALDCKMYLRIAPELYLKRLLVGGMERVFEINRNFRNEGLSRQHNPEFTMLEAYQAYGDCRTMMDLIEDLICTVAEKVCGTLLLKHPSGRVINLERPWKRIPFYDLIAWHGGMDWETVSHADRVSRAKTLELAVDDSWTDTEIAKEIYEKLIEPTLINPTFVTRLPKEMVPLAKACEDDDQCVDVYELAINGQEISPGYSELNDPVEQRKRFEQQLAANPDNPEVFEKIDEDFLTAMQHGMPPAGGLGLGIDRLVMMLTGAESIREVILFPHLRPK